MDTARYKSRPHLVNIKGQSPDGLGSINYQQHTSLATHFADNLEVDERAIAPMGTKKINFEMFLRLSVLLVALSFIRLSRSGKKDQWTFAIATNATRGSSCNRATTALVLRCARMSVCDECVRCVCVYVHVCVPIMVSWTWEHEESRTSTIAHILPRVDIGCHLCTRSRVCHVRMRVHVHVHVHVHVRVSSLYLSLRVCVCAHART